jgi:hypothetical protein
MFFGALEVGNDESSDNCRACRRKLGQSLPPLALTKRCAACGAAPGILCWSFCENTKRGKRPAASPTGETK